MRSAMRSLTKDSGATQSAVTMETANIRRHSGDSQRQQMKRGAGAEAAVSKRVRRAAPRPPPPPPTAYWQTSADGAGGGASLFTTRYMRRKLEYLMRSCATHPGALKLKMSNGVLI